MRETDQQGAADDIVADKAAELGALARAVARLREDARTVAASAAEIEAGWSLLTTVFNALDQGIAVFSQNERLLAANAAYSSLLALPSNLTRPGISLWDVMAHQIRQGYLGPGDTYTLLTHAKQRWSGQDDTWEQRHADGRWLRVGRAPLPHGEVMMVVTDISATRAAEAALRASEARLLEADRMKNEFLASMSHELRTPLNAILGFSEVITTGLMGDLPPKVVEYCKDIHASGVHLLAIINQVLDLSKIEAGRFELDLEIFDLPSIVQFACAMLSPEAQAKWLNVETLLPPDLPRLNADRRVVGQILLNLLSNAVKFTPEGGRVTVEGRIDLQGDLLLIVTDTGIGIDIDEQDRVFEPFRRASHGPARRITGSGLGLPISRSFMELHGGSLAIESKPGQGTRITARFPSARVVPGTPEAPPRPEPPKSAPRPRA
ncbi:sensor histidine kinase [Zavarzinia sp. CC-PAN008]|uniref:sensor histidine kinase n=1 Tax=Zavarzinia sp. CC-PAN008 TaxID=3243332 RepID=UPI003F746D4D